MNFGQAISSCFSKYATFSGRARRSEYWYWTLFAFLVSLLVYPMDGIAFGMWGFWDAGPLGTFSSLALFVPSLAVSIRRLHDINKSGWWFLTLLTGIGILLLLYWAVLPSKEEEPTRYTEAPGET